MLSVTMLGRARIFSNRARLFSGVALSALTIGVVANAQQQPTSQEQQTPSVPAQSQQPASGAPAAPEAPATNSTSATQLPQIVVAGATPKAKPKRSVQATQPAPTPAQDVPTPQQAALNAQMTKMNEARDTNILTKIGATTSTFTREAIVSMPQGDNTPIDKLILQFPGVSYNSAASNPNFHVRSEYANVQTRINGVVIPEGVSGLGALIDTNFIAKISLLTGTLMCAFSRGT